MRAIFNPDVSPSRFLPTMHERHTRHILLLLSYVAGCILHDYRLQGALQQDCLWQPLLRSLLRLNKSKHKAQSQREKGEKQKQAISNHIDNIHSYPWCSLSAKVNRIKVQGQGSFYHAHVSGICGGKRNRPDLGNLLTCVMMKKAASLPQSWHTAADYAQCYAEAWGSTPAKSGSTWWQYACHQSLCHTPLPTAKALHAEYAQLQRQQPSVLCRCLGKPPGKNDTQDPCHELVHHYIAGLMVLPSGHV